MADSNVIGDPTIRPLRLKLKHPLDGVPLVGIRSVETVRLVRLAGKDLGVMQCPLVDDRLDA
ncbi:MAG: hypothetical protein ACPGWS_01355 [Solirubrobacterales bacterium]